VHWLERWRNSFGNVRWRIVGELDRIEARYRERDASASLSGFWSLRNPVVLHLAQERERAVLRALSVGRVQLSELKLLDIGCGLGVEFASYLRWGSRVGQLFGIDLMGDRLRIALRDSPAEVAQASGAALPFSDGAFDIVCQNVVFSSIVDDELRRATAAEMRRVLRSGGWVLWYDAARTRGRDPHFRPVPRNEVESLFPGVRWHWQRLSSDLGLLRRVADVLGEPGMQALDATGLFRTHLLGLGRLA